MRLLIWLIFFLVIFLAVKSRMRSMQENLRKSVREEFEKQSAGMAAQHPAAKAEDMVACAHCGVYLPASEAVSLVTPSSRQFFCSEVHLKAYPGQQISPDRSATHE